MAYNAKTNWQTNDTVMPADMNRIEQGIKDLDLQKLTKNATILYAGSNLNDCKELGTYTWLGSASQNISNSPEAAECIMLVLPRLDNYAPETSASNRTQVVFSSTNRMYIRQLINNVWGNWSDGPENFTAIKKYSVPSISLENVGEQTLYTNPLPNTWTMAPRNPLVFTNGIYSLRGSYTGGNTFIYYVCDGKSDSYWDNTATGDGWLAIDFGSPLTIKKIKLKLEVSGAGTDGFKIQGSNDWEPASAAWTDLYVNTGIIAPSDSSEFTLTTTGNYRYYRVFFPELEGAGSGTKICRIYNLQLTEYITTAYNVNYNLPNLILNHWSGGQIVLLEIPADSVSGAIYSNRLNTIPIDAVLQGGRRYELIYRVSNFQAKEVV